MSVAQDEIAEQINSIKVEWKETVDAMHSSAPPGMSRADLKEVYCPHQNLLPQFPHTCITHHEQHRETVADMFIRCI